MSIETWKSGDLISFVIDGEKRQAIVTSVERDQDDPSKWLVRFIVDPEDADDL